MQACVAVTAREAGTHRATRRARAACVLLAFAALAACTTGFVYNRLDWVVAWYVDGLVSLDEAQEDRLHQVLHDTLAWHREAELPKYIALLDAMADEADRPVSAAQLDLRYRQVAGYLDDFLRHVTPEAADVLGTLTPEQRTELRESLEEDNEDLWDEFAGDSPEERHARRVKSAVRSLQRFTGRLNAGQKALVEAHLVGMHDVSEQWLDRRRQWQRRFFEVLGSTPRGPALEAALLDLALNPNQFDSGDYRRLVDDNRRIVMGMIAELSGGLTPAQRLHLRRKFEEYAADLREVAAAGRATGRQG